MCTLITIVFSFLLSLSLLREIPTVSKALGRFSTFMSFIPNWSFFAPTPGMYDYHLLYRGVNHSGEVLDWVEALSVKDKRGPFAFIWHPDKKILKTIIDLTQELVRFSVLVNDNKQICLSIPYLHILNYISSLQHESSIKKVQFMILSSSKLFDYNVEFLSSTHLISLEKT